MADSVAFEYLEGRGIVKPLERVLEYVVVECRKEQLRKGKGFVVCKASVKKYFLLAHKELGLNGVEFTHLSIYCGAVNHDSVEGHVRRELGIFLGGQCEF